MLMEVTIVDGERRLVFTGNRRLALSPGMKEEDVNHDASLLAVDARRKIFLHDNDAGGVDVHIRYDGLLPPKNWWEQAPGDVMLGEVSRG